MDVKYIEASKVDVIRGEMKTYKVPFACLKNFVRKFEGMLHAAYQFIGI